MRDVSRTLDNLQVLDVSDSIVFGDYLHLSRSDSGCFVLLWSYTFPAPYS